MLNAICNEIVAWREHNFPNATPDQQFKGIVEEVGELAHADLKAAQGIRGGEDHEAKRRDAVVDIFVFLVNYADMHGIDFPEALVEVWTKVRQRDWQKYPQTGRPTHARCGNCGATGYVNTLIGDKIVCAACNGTGRVSLE